MAKRIKDLNPASALLDTDVIVVDQPNQSGKETLVNLKAYIVSDVNTELATKADTTYVDTELATKADTTYVDTELATKSDTTYVDAELATKSDTTYVDTELATKSDSVASIASLKAFTDAVDNRSVNLLGYYSEGDGGGGTFFWDAASTDADNGGTTIAATGVTTGRWKRLYSGALNVKWFGAKGDGSTDDTLAIRTAFEYMTSSGICGAVFTAGTYLISSAIELPRPVYTGYFKLEGFSAVIKTTSAITMWQRLPLTQWGDATGLVSGYTPVIEGFIFEGTSTSASRVVGQRGVMLGATYQAVVRNCQFVKLDDGLHLAFSLNGDYSNLRFVNCTNQPFNGRSGAAILDGIGNNAALWPLATVSNSSFNANIIRNVRVYGSDISDSNFWCFAGDQNTWSGCISEGGSTLYDFYYDSQGNTGVNQNAVVDFWCEAPNAKCNFKIGFRGNFTIERAQRIYPAAFVDMSGASASSHLIVKGQTYWGNMPNGGDPANPYNRWFYHVGSTGYGGVDNNSGGNGSSGRAATFSECGAPNGLGSSFFDPAKWSEGQKHYQGTETLWQGANGGRITRTTNGCTFSSLNDNAVVRFENPISLGPDGGVIDNVRSRFSVPAFSSTLAAGATDRQTVPMAGLLFAEKYLCIANPTNGVLPDGLVWTVQPSANDEMQIAVTNVSSGTLNASGKQWTYGYILLN